jgi:hypothetical protein
MHCRMYKRHAKSPSATPQLPYDTRAFARRDFIEKLCGVQDMTLVVFAALCADCERLATTKVNALIAPNLGNNTCNKSEIVVSHTKLGLAGVQSMHEQGEHNGVRPRHKHTVSMP